MKSAGDIKLGKAASVLRGSWQIGKWSVKKSTQQFQQIQQNFNKVKKETKWVNTKCEAQLAKSIEDKKCVTIVVNDVELQQKQTLVPVLTGVGKVTTLCYSSPVRPPLETTN